MKPQDLSQFKKMFEMERAKLIYSQSVVNEALQLNRDDLKDEVDMTSTEMETGMRIRLRNREALFLKKINDALERIKAGSYGECGDCGEEIGLKRLQARPTAELCISCKEEREHSEKIHIDGRQAKSLGKKMRFA